MTCAGGSGLGQQLLDNRLRLLVFAFAEVVMPDQPAGVGEVDGRPVVIVESTPYRIVIVDRDRVTDPHLPHGPADVLDVSLERELGCVHADDHQSLAGVFPGPCAYRCKLPQQLHAGTTRHAADTATPSRA